MNGPVSRADAVSRDAAFLNRRKDFNLPPGVVYLCGNSLGALPRAVPARVAEVVATEWGTDLVSSWNKADWTGLASRIGALIAPMIGAAPNDVALGDSTSVTLFKIFSAAARLRPDRRVIVIEPTTFPTDGYIAAGVAESLGLELRWCDPADPAASLDDEVAFLSLTHVDFRSGAMYDLEGVTRAAHAAGALMVWDLCHSVGAVPVDLTAAGADFAVGCTYKYLNGGPGSPAFCWVRPDLQDRVQQPITGWWGHRHPFSMERDFAPAVGIGRMVVGTPPVLALSALETALTAFDGVTMAELRAKSLSLSDLFIALVDERLADGRLHDFALITPREPTRRGSQVALRHPSAYGIVQALIARGIIGDFREPDVVRVGFAPLYVTHADVYDAVEHLVAVMHGKEYAAPTYAVRNAVT